MTIPYCIQVGDVDSNKKEIEEIVRGTFSEIDAIYNNWNPESEVAKLAQLAAYEKIQLSSKLASFLGQVDRWVHLTEGRFDPTIEPLQRLWKHYLNHQALPPQDKINELLPSIGWHTVHLEDGWFWKEHALTAIDLGGVAKGFTVDLLLEKLADAGYQNLYIEWGGEIRTLGEHPNKRPWKIAIIGATSLELHDLAIATSGSYLQNWTVHETVYTHIIDPRTKKPLSKIPIQSASVMAPTCAEADALATALMLFPTIEEARHWAQAHHLHVILW